MSTFALDLIENFDTTWEEVNTLIDLAIDFEKNEKKYNALCRTTTVLIVANFEGFLSQVMKCIINDINRNNAFNKASEKIKITFCSQFLGDEKNEKKRRKLIDKFNEMDTKIDIEPFLYENKNPKVSIIEKYFDKLGGEKFLGYISNCDIEDVFENDSIVYNNILKRVKDALHAGIIEFPYSIELDGIGLNLTNKGPIQDSLWNTFIDNTLKARHDVAHGISQDNTLSINEIKLIRDKIILLEMIFALLSFKVAIKPVV